MNGSLLPKIQNAIISNFLSKNPSSKAKFKKEMFLDMSRDSSVSIATGYRLDYRGSIPGGGWEFSLRHRVQTGSGPHTASYPMGTRGSFPRGKAAGA
jgi:hypothetical protein